MKKQELQTSNMHETIEIEIEIETIKNMSDPSIHQD